MLYPRPSPRTSWQGSHPAMSAQIVGLYDNVFPRFLALQKDIGQGHTRLLHRIHDLACVSSTFLYEFERIWGHRADFLACDVRARQDAAIPQIACLVVRSHPHHVISRGNRRQRAFFCDDEFRAYLGLTAEWCRLSGLGIWAYCLMLNHLPLIAVAKSENRLRRCVGKGHWRDVRRVNSGEQCRGHVWQGRFASFVLDNHYLLAATVYVEVNLVLARMVDRLE